MYNRVILIGNFQQVQPVKDELAQLLSGMEVMYWHDIQFEAGDALDQLMVTPIYVFLGRDLGALEQAIKICNSTKLPIIIMSIDGVRMVKDSGMDWVDGTGWSKDIGALAQNIKAMQCEPSEVVNLPG